MRRKKAKCKGLQQIYFSKGLPRPEKRNNLRAMKAKTSSDYWQKQARFKKRRQAILKLHLAGWPPLRIGKRYKITRQRVEQIVADMGG